LKKSKSRILPESELYNFNDLPLNFVSLSEKIAVICLGQNYMVSGGINEVFVKLSQQIAKGSQGKLSEKMAYDTLMNCSKFYKKVFDSDINFPNVLHLYTDAWDVETEGGLNVIFKSFYILQGYMLFIGRHALQCNQDIIEGFFKEKGYRHFATEQHLLEEKRIKLLAKNTLTQNHMKLLTVDPIDPQFDFAQLLPIVQNIAVYSGYSELEGTRQYNELIHRLNDAVYNWSEVTKLNYNFVNFPGRNGFKNSDDLIHLIGMAHRIEFANHS
jgi:hypothetical protein